MNPEVGERMKLVLGEIERCTIPREREERGTNPLRSNSVSSSYLSRFVLPCFTPLHQSTLISFLRISRSLQSDISLLDY